MVHPCVVTQHHILNSKDFAKKLSGVKLEEDEMLNSHDVVSLFTNVPIPEAMKIIRQNLMDDNDLKNRTNLSVDDVMSLLEFVMSTTYFTFRGKIYEQVYGTAMGSPVSVVVSNLYMEWLEQEAIRTAPLDIKPRMWLRYVDDVWEIVKRGKVEPAPRD